MLTRSLAGKPIEIKLGEQRGIPTAPLIRHWNFYAPGEKPPQPKLDVAFKPMVRR